MEDRDGCHRQYCNYRDMTANSVLMTNCREYDDVVCVANGVALPIESNDNIPKIFESNNVKEIDLQLLSFVFPEVTASCRLMSSSHAIPVTHSRRL